MAQVTIRSLSRVTRNISLRRQYDGIDGRCLYIRPREIIQAPAEIAKEPELQREAKAGLVSVTGGADEKKDTRKKEKTTKPGKKSRGKKRKED